jgi:patatin-like phospholipase/acyl hydrolase
MTNINMNTKKILTIDGGGVRIIIPLYYLKYLEEDLLKITGKGIYEHFDLYGGTSAGSLLLSTLIYTDKKRINEIIDTVFTNENMIKIFSETNISYHLGMAPKYKSDNKIKLVSETLKTKKMSQTNGKDAIFTLYCLTSQKGKYFKSYHKYAENTLVSDIINAGSSVPTLFSPFKYTENGIEKYSLDGAIFANNNSDLVYAEALALYPKTHLKILSLGTGDNKFEKLGAETVNWGFIKWAKPLVNLVFDTGQGITDYKTKEFAKALGHDYIRVHKPVEIDLDDITKIDELKKIAKQWYDETYVDVINMLTR